MTVSASESDLSFSADRSSDLTAGLLMRSDPDARLGLWFASAIATSRVCDVDDKSVHCLAAESLRDSSFCCRWPALRNPRASHFYSMQRVRRCRTSFNGYEMHDSTSSSVSRLELTLPMEIRGPAVSLTG